MADTTNVSMCDNATEMSGSCTPNAVCIDAMRVYDSCSDKDCLTDLRVYFTDATQQLVNNATNVRIKDADVITVITNLEPVPFNKGFYSVDITFFFDVSLDLYTAPGTVPTQVNGVAVYSKKVILFGSDGSVKVFVSEYGNDSAETESALSRSMPRVTVQVAKPIALSAKLTNCMNNCCVPCKVPKCVCCRLGDEPVSDGTKCVVVTIGMFSIIQMERNVQMLVHAYDFCVPEKECTSSTDNPCEVFSRLDFPKDQFFPPNFCDKGSSCGCQ